MYILYICCINLPCNYVYFMRIKKTLEKPKWQSRMDNPEKLTTLGTQDEDTKPHSFTFFGNK
jgi:hypothetical protein